MNSISIPGFADVREPATHALPPREEDDGPPFDAALMLALGAHAHPHAQPVPPATPAVTLASGTIDTIEGAGDEASAGALLDAGSVVAAPTPGSVSGAASGLAALARAIGELSRSAELPLDGLTAPDAVVAKLDLVGGNGRQLEPDVLAAGNPAVATATQDPAAATLAAATFAALAGIDPAHLTALHRSTLGAVARALREHAAAVATSATSDAGAQSTGKTEAAATTGAAVPAANGLHSATPADPASTADDQAGSGESPSQTPTASAETSAPLPEAAPLTAGAPPRPAVVADAARAEVVAPAARALPETPTARPSDHVTVRFGGEDGLEGSVRVALRGQSLHATITAPDLATAHRLQNEIGDLHQVLADRGFSDARITLNEARSRGASSAGAEERGESGTREEAERQRHDAREAPDDRSRRRPGGRKPEER